MLARMSAAIEHFIATGPFLGVYTFLFFVVALRSTATFAIARYVNRLMLAGKEPTGGWRLRMWNWAHAAPTQHAVHQLRTRGLILIPLSFLTVGVQSVVILAAGLLGLSVPRYAAAAFPGWLAWAGIYSTIGFAVWGAAMKAAAGSPVGIAVIAVAALALIVYVVHARRKRQAAVIPVKVQE